MAGLYAISIAALTIGGSIWFLVFGGRLLKTMKMHKDLPKRDKAVRKVRYETIDFSTNNVCSAGSTP
jgi:hypothetical protein